MNIVTLILINNSFKNHVFVHKFRVLTSFCEEDDVIINLNQSFPKQFKYVNRKL